MLIQATSARSIPTVGDTDPNNKRGGPSLRQDLYARSHRDKPDKGGQHHRQQQQEQQGGHNECDVHRAFDDLSVNSGFENPFGSGDSVTGTKSQSRSLLSNRSLWTDSNTSLPNHSSHSLTSSNPNRSLLNSSSHHSQLLTSSSHHSHPTESLTSSSHHSQSLTSSSHHSQSLTSSSHHSYQSQRGCQQRVPSSRSFASETPSYTSRWSSASCAIRKQQRDEPTRVDSSRTSSSLQHVMTESSSFVRRGGKRVQVQHQTDSVFLPQSTSQQQQDLEIILYPDVDMGPHKCMVKPLLQPTFPRQQQRRASASQAQQQQPRPSSFSSSRHNRPVAASASVAASATRTRPQHGPPSKRGSRPQPKPQRRASIGASPTTESCSLSAAIDSMEMTCNAAERRRIRNQQQQHQQQQQQRRSSTGGGPPVTTSTTRGRSTQRGSQPKRSVSLGRIPRLEPKRSVSHGRTPRLEPSLHDTSEHSTHRRHYCDISVCGFMADDGLVNRDLPPQAQQTQQQDAARTNLFESNQFEYACARKQLEMKHARFGSGICANNSARPSPPQSLRSPPPQRRASTGGGPPTAAASAAVATDIKDQRRRSSNGGEGILHRKKPIKAHRRASADTSVSYSNISCHGDCPQCHGDMPKSSTSRLAPKARRLSSMTTGSSVNPARNTGGDQQLRRYSIQHEKGAPPGCTDKTNKVVGRRPSSSQSCHGVQWCSRNDSVSNNNTTYKRIIGINRMRRNQTERPTRPTSLLSRTWSNDSLEDCSSFH
jgi:hypothetical protein